MRANVNTARRLRKQKEIPRRAFYSPDILAQNAWAKLYGSMHNIHLVMERPEMPDFIQPNQPFNPRALPKEGGIPDYMKERRLSVLMADYADTSGRDIFDTNIIHNNKIYSAVMKSVGLDHSADAINTWTSEVFAGTSPAITKVAKRVLPEKVHGGLLSLRRNLSRAVFPLNFTWNMFIQTSSAGITFARYGTIANIKGLSYLTSPTMNQAVQQIAYSQIVKSRWGGKLHYQDVQDSITKNKRLQASKLDSVTEYANFLTSAIENLLTGHAVASAYYYGKNHLGLTGRALWEYASEGGAKTQSMYNYADLPGLLRAREVGAVTPFQTFAFDVFNTVREINVPILRSAIGRVGIYHTISSKEAPPEGGKVDPDSDAGRATIRRRLMILGRWVAAIMVTNAVVDKSIGRKPWTVSSFVPFFGYIMGQIPYVGEYVGGPQSGRGTTPFEYFSDLATGIQRFMKYEDFTKLRQWLLRYHTTAGVQWDRTIQGIEAVARGEVTDVRGHQLFRVRGTSEQVRAVLGGPFRTEAGIEYLREKDKKKGLSKKRARQTISRGRKR